MKKVDWKTVIEIVGITAIVVSLIFVGWQIQQDREIAVAQNMLSVAADKKSWAELMTANSSIWVKANSELALTPEEDEVYRAMAQALNVQYFVDWFRAQQVPGANPPDSFAFQFALLLNENPGLLKWWQRKLDEWASENEYTGVESDPWSDTVNRALGEIRDRR